MRFHSAIGLRGHTGLKPDAVRFCSLPNDDEPKAQVFPPPVNPWKEHRCVRADIEKDVLTDCGFKYNLQR